MGPTSRAFRENLDQVCTPLPPNGEKKEFQPVPVIANIDAAPGAVSIDYHKVEASLRTAYEPKSGPQCDISSGINQLGAMCRELFSAISPKEPANMQAQPTNWNPKPTAFGLF